MVTIRPSVVFYPNSPLHGPAQFRLLDLQLGQQVDEPLEGALIAVDPKEVHLAQVHHRLGNLAGPLELAPGAAVARLPVPMHDGLQNGGEGSNSDARANEHSMLGPEDVARRSSIRTIDEDLWRIVRLNT